MSYKNILEAILPSKKSIPQLAPLPGQVANAAGGYYFPIDDWMLLDRFLILGTESGTYYVNAVELTKKNVTVIMRLLQEDGIKVVDRIVEIATQNRAPKIEPLLFALSLGASCDNAETRKAALDALLSVATIGTHILKFAEYINHMRGWGRGLRKGIANWFLNMDNEKLGLQAIKYMQREGWGLRDLLRLSHPKTNDIEKAALFDWIAHPKKEEAIENAAKVSRLIKGKYQVTDSSSIDEVACIIEKYSLPREAIPTRYLSHKEIWNALLVDMPMTAMIRNLGKMSAVGLLEPFEEATRYVSQRLVDEDQLKHGRIHPIQLLLALYTYSKGKGVLGSLSWPIAAPIVQALNNAFELSFKQVTPTGKRIMIGIDVSGSMQQQCVGSKVINCLEAAVAITMLFVRVEKQVHTIAFDTQMYEFPITPCQRIDDILSHLNKWGGGTDLSLPVKYALIKKLKVDAFIVLTDNETWAGNEHTVQSLQKYRSTINPNAKLIVLAASANGGVVCDPNDPLSFAIAGFDSAAPQLITDFINSDI